MEVIEKKDFIEIQEDIPKENDFKNVKISISQNKNHWIKNRKWMKYFLYLVFFILIIIIFVIFLNLKKSESWENEELIIHALGEMNNAFYTNSYEALKYWNKEKKMNLFEVDLHLTKDNHVVLSHDFDHLQQIPDLEEFKKTKSKGNLTSMIFEDLVKYMKKNKNVYVITDSKYPKREEIIIEFDEITKILKKYKGVNSRFIIQIYNENMYQIFKEKKYPFNNFLFTLYMRWHKDFDDLEQIFKFCKENKIKGVVIWKDFLNEKIIELSKNYSTPVYLHTENNVEIIYDFLKKGVKGVYTDNVDSSSLNEYIKRKDYNLK